MNPIFLRIQNCHGCFGRKNCAISATIDRATKLMNFSHVFPFAREFSNVMIFEFLQLKLSAYKAVIIIQIFILTSRFDQHKTAFDTWFSHVMIF